MQVQTYLFFDGRCEEAIDFYRGALGAEVTMLMRFKDCPQPAQESPAQEGCTIAPGTENKVMHASLRIGDATVLVSDGRCTGQTVFQGFALPLDAPSEAEAERRFAAVGSGGQVQMPLAKTFFAKSFGMVIDRFGVTWM